MADEISGEVKTSIVETNEEPFRPGQQSIQIVLQPKPEEDPYVPPEAPPAPTPPMPSQPDPFDWSYAPVTVPELDIAKKFCVINVETTGLLPYDSRIQSIVAISIDDPDNPQVFFDLDEMKIVQDFVTWFQMNAFSGLIGYNVGFDYRFLFAKACKYGLRLPAWQYVELLDLQNRMKQVKASFVYGNNQPGSLDVWAEYLLGISPPMTQEEELESYKNKDYEACIEYNKYKAFAAYLIYSLTEYVIGE